MRIIERTRAFRRDYKRESRGTQGIRLDLRLAPVLTALANDIPLASHFHDHALSGPWADFRDCHVRPDLILIYQKDGSDILRLVRLGSHAKLGL